MELPSFGEGFSTMEERALALANILGSCITSAATSAAQASIVKDPAKRSQEYSCHDLEAHAHPAAPVQIASAVPARVMNSVAPQPAAIVPLLQLAMAGAKDSLQKSAAGLQITALQEAAARAYEEAKALLLQQQLVIAGTSASLQKTADITAAVRACEEATSLMQQQQLPAPRPAFPPPPPPPQQHQLAIAGVSASLEKSADHTEVAPARANEEAISLLQPPQRHQQPRQRQQQQLNAQQLNQAQNEYVNFCTA